MSIYVVSIIIPTYNRAHLIGETLDSVIAQTYDKWECIVVDDGSTDYTEELIELYCEKDTRIQYHHRPKSRSKGANACRNYGADLSAGEFLMWLDDDDLLHKGKIERQIDLAKCHPYSIITCSWGRLYHKKKIHIKELKIYKDYNESIDLLVDYGNHEFFPAHCFLLPSVVYHQAGPWLENLSINQDGEFFCRAIIASKHVKFANNTFVVYRADNDKKTSVLSSTNKGKDLIRSWKIIERSLLNYKMTGIDRYIKNGKKHAYTLLKERGYRLLILKNALFFNCFIQEDLLRKLKTFIER